MSTFFLTLFRFFLKICALGMCAIHFSLFGLLIWKSILFFQEISFHMFLFQTEWNPHLVLEKVWSGFGALPIFLGTVLIACVTLVVVGPIGVMASIYLTEYASPRISKHSKAALEFFAGIPTLVYGLVAVLVIVPLLQEGCRVHQFSIAPESALVVGIMMGIMNFPFVVTMTSDIFRSLPPHLRQAGWALGSTDGEVIRRLVLPASIPGLFAVFLLALSRTIGETMIVFMTASLTTQWTLNPLQPTTSVTAQIVSLLTGDESPDSPKTQAAFALGLVLCILTLVLNLLGAHFVKRYRTRHASPL